MEQEFSLWWKDKPLVGDVCMNVIFYFPDNRKRDMDTHLKALQDSMTGIVYEDDSQINEMHVFKCIDKENPRVEVSIL